MIALVLNINKRFGGLESFEKLMRQGKQFDTTLKSFTPDGFHLYYTFPHPKMSIPSITNLFPGIDCLADFRYCVAPGSENHEGAPYTWEDLDQEIAILPRWLLNEIRKRKKDESGCTSRKSKRGASHE